MPAIGNHLEGTVKSVASGAAKSKFLRMWCCGSPWIVLTINERQPREAEGEPAEPVDFFDVWVRRKRIGFSGRITLPADFGGVLECDKARDLQKTMNTFRASNSKARHARTHQLRSGRSSVRNGGSSLEVAPIQASLVRPGNARAERSCLPARKR